MAIEPRGEACAHRRGDRRNGEKAIMPLKIGFVNAPCNTDERSDPAGDSIGLVRQDCDYCRSPGMVDTITDFQASETIDLSARSLS